MKSTTPQSPPPKRNPVKYSIVIPVYRSSQCLPELARRLQEALEPLGQPYEVILVDDGSPDGSWEVIRTICTAHPAFHGVQLLKNFGQARATMSGIQFAQGEVVITMDDDLQHDPHLIPKLLEILERDGGYDCLFAYFPEKRHAAYRNLASRVIRWINAHAFGSKEIRISSFRVMRHYMADLIRENRSISATVGALLLANASRIAYHPLPHSERFAGQSNYTFAKQIRLAFDNICNVSMLPLRLISATGLIAASLSGLLLLYFLFKYFTGSVTQAGWTSLVILITFFSGLILLSLGVIGEYLVRVLRELQGGPAVAIRETVGFASTPDDRSERTTSQPPNS